AGARRRDQERRPGRDGPHGTRPQGSAERDALSPGARSGPAARQPAGRDRSPSGRRGASDEPMSPLRSRTITAGVERTPNRAMLRAVGFGDQDFTKPIIGIANAHSTITPCNAKLTDLALRAGAAGRAAGRTPQTLGTITVGRGISIGPPA